MWLATLSLAASPPGTENLKLFIGFAAMPTDVRKVSDLPTRVQRVRGCAPAFSMTGAKPQSHKESLGRSETFRTSGGRADFQRAPQACVADRTPAISAAT